MHARARIQQMVDGSEFLDHSIHIHRQLDQGNSTYKSRVTGGGTTAAAASGDFCRNIHSVTEKDSTRMTLRILNQLQEDSVN